jgi:hypothetical protein
MGNKKTAWLILIVTPENAASLALINKSNLPSKSDK